MKVTKKNKNYNLTLDEFEAKVLKTLIGHVGIVNDFGKITNELYSKLDTEDFCNQPVYIDNKKYNYPNIQIRVNKPMLIIKKDCSFLYPKSNYRFAGNSNIDSFEPRNLKEAYIEGDYLCGIDDSFKKFKMNLVKHLVWAN